MNGALAVTMREMQERRFLLPVAVGSGLLPVVVRALAGDRPGARAAAELMAFVMLAAVPVAVGLALGMSVLGRDLAERRLGFYFARPLGGVAIWGGKMLAAVLLTLATTGLLFALRLIFFPDLFPDAGNVRRAASLVWLAPLLVLVVAHALSCLFRARSGMIHYDAAAFLVCAGAASWVVKALLDAGALGTLFGFVAPGFVVGLVAILLLASAAQVIVGRTDVRRGHRALSTVLWGLIAALILMLGLFVHWVLSVVPEARGAANGRRRVHVHPAPAGDYFFLTRFPGRAGYQPLFLMNAANGRFVNLGAYVRTWLAGADGRHAVWIENAFSRLVLVKARLDGPEPVITRVPLDADGWLKALSADGTRVAISSKEGIRVYETGTGRLVAHVRVTVVRAASFLAAGTVRLYHTPPTERPGPDRTIVVSDWDLGTGALAERGRIGRPEGLHIHDLRGRQLLVVERSAARGGPATLALYDAESGRRERTLVEGAAGFDTAAWMNDGRIALLTSGTPHARLRVLGEGGEEELSVELPKRLAFWAGEVGGVIVLGSFDPPSRSAADTVFVDAKSGAIRVETELSPEFRGPRPWSGYEDPAVVAAADGLVGRLFHGRNGGLFLVDPTTGQKRTLLPD